MSYNHILVAVDFYEGTLDVLNKAIRLAKPLNAKVSLVHVNTQINDTGIFSGLIDTELVGIEINHPMADETNKQLDELIAKVDYPIANKFMVNGTLSHDLEGPVKEAGVDLIVCGHHHDFWSRISPSASGLINTSAVDLLIVSLEN